MDILRTMGEKTDRDNLKMSKSQDLNQRRARKTTTLISNLLKLWDTCVYVHIHKHTYKYIYKISYHKMPTR